MTNHRAVRGLLVPMALFLLSTGTHAAGPADDDFTEGALTDVREHIDAERYDEALALLEPMTVESPDDADAWNLLGFAQRNLGQYEVAQTSYNRALALDPDHLGALEYLGELYIETGRREQAVPLLEQLRALCGTTCDEYLDLAEALDQK